MKQRAKPLALWMGLSLLLAVPVGVLADVPVVSNVMVTDVTTTSFSVVWASSEPSTAGIDVFLDEYGTQLATGATATSHPINSGSAAIKTAAEDNGVMKVRVAGLEPSTTYYFKTTTTSKLTADETEYPPALPLPSVNTEMLTTRTLLSLGNTVPFSNDIIAKECYLSDNTTAAEGTLLIATVKGGSHPVTAFVGDGIDPPGALIDLNNFFSDSLHQTLDLAQGLNLTFLNLRGTLGNSIVTLEVPQDQNLSEVKEPAFALRPGWNMVSFPLEPENSSVENVLAPILNSISAIWAYSASEGRWLFYDKNGLPFLNELNELHSYAGYWLYVDQPEGFVVHGGISARTLSLNSGWNLIGSKSVETLPIDQAFMSIWDKLISIWSYDTNIGSWKFYDKNGLPFLNSLESIEPGNAYWIYLNQDCQW